MALKYKFARTGLQQYAVSFLSFLVSVLYSLQDGGPRTFHWQRPRPVMFLKGAGNEMCSTSIQ